MELMRMEFRDWFIVGLFVVLSVCTLIGIWRSLRNRRQPAPDPEQDRIFRIGLYIVAVMAVILVMIPDVPASDAAPQKHRKIVLDLADCPPMGKGMTPVVIFVVDTSAENHAGRKNAYCSRMAQRSYLTSRQPTPPTTTR